ncbi:MAG: hypothetical protein KME30_26975 [Iphinoe sp. HA4291-MV1]|jgi:hypothetical protein|nr:hypothetical protein [Iphinoe sp. HA4291-MV1]
MNNKDFDAFLAISGMEPTQPDTPPSKPQSNKSDNIFGAPAYRGENTQDLTEDERRAETTDRSDIDDLTSKQNFSSAVASVGAGLTVTIGVSSVAGASGAGLGAGIGLVGCLVFGTEALSGKKSGIVRLGAMTIGTGFAGYQLWNSYAQESAVSEINHAVELYVVKRKQEGITFDQLATWAMYGVLALAVMHFLLQPKKPKVEKKSDLF